MAEARDFFESLVTFHPADTVTLSNDALAIDEVMKHAERTKRSGNFLTSALSVLRHVESTEGLSAVQRTRLVPVLDEQEEHLEAQLANVRAFRSALMFPRQEKYVGDTDAADPWSHFSRLFGSLPNPVDEDADDIQRYWRGVRDDLSTWFALSLEQLSASLGVAYATFANLGKRKPQGRTIRPILKIHALAKACLDAGGEAARGWLATDGAAMLTERGIATFEDAANDRLLGQARVRRGGIPVEDEPDAFSGWRKREKPLARGERL